MFKIKLETKVEMLEDELIAFRSLAKRMALKLDQYGDSNLHELVLETEAMYKRHRTERGVE